MIEAAVATFPGGSNWPARRRRTCLLSTPR